MGRRTTLAARLAVAGLAGFLVAAAHAGGSISDTVIFATNSVHLHSGVLIQSGDVVVNEASDGPVLGAGAELTIERLAQVAGAASADSIVIARGAAVAGALACNELDDQNRPVQHACGPIELPVFPAADVPPFQEANLRAGAPDLAAYGEITIDQGGVARFAGGIVDVASILQVSTVGGQCSFPCRSVELLAPTSLRVAGRFDPGSSAFVGPADGTTAPSDHIVYVGGANAVPGDPASEPPAVKIGQQSVIEATLWAGHGTLRIDRSSRITGALFGRDVQIDRDSEVDLAGAFNPPPVAFPQSVETVGGEVTIVLTGSDPEGEPLTFSIEVLPANGTLEDSNGSPVAAGAPLPDAVVVYTGADGVADNFVFRVTDPNGGFDNAVVSINVTDDPLDPPPVEGILAEDGFVEVAQDTATAIGLRAAASDDVGDLLFFVGSGCSPSACAGPDHGTLSAPDTSGSGSPVRSASVTYSPDAGFTGSDGFVFKACESAAQTQCDQGSIDIEVVETAPPEPPLAEDQSVTTGVDEAVTIDLAAPIGADEPTDEVGRGGGN